MALFSYVGLYVPRVSGLEISLPHLLDQLGSASKISASVTLKTSTSLFRTSVPVILANPQISPVFPGTVAPETENCSQRGLRFSPYSMNVVVFGDMKLLPCCRTCFILRVCRISVEIRSRVAKTKAGP